MIEKPSLRVRYELQEVGTPDLAAAIKMVAVSSRRILPGSRLNRSAPGGPARTCLTGLERKERLGGPLLSLRDE